MPSSFDLLAHVLTASTDPFGTATEIGRQVLDDEDVRQSARSTALRDEMQLVEDVVANLPASVWPGGSSAADLAAWLDVLAAERGDNSDAAARKLGMQPELLLIATLRGLCSGPLLRAYEACVDRIALRRGSPVMLPRRPVKAVFGAVTPNPNKQNPHHPLASTRFRLFPFDTVDSTRLVLDFSHAQAIDRATWSKHPVPSIPSVATIHPHESLEDLDVAQVDGSRFFGVHPIAWNERAVLDQLRCAKHRGAAIAVLPELTMPAPGILETALRTHSSEVPSIVVAGSAHLESEGTKRNEVRLYVDGVEAIRHAKVRPFVAPGLPKAVLDRLQPADRTGPWTEGLTSEPKTVTVLSGRHGRLAVLICADFNDAPLVAALARAGVNHVLVPSLTPELGAFQVHCGTLSGDAQAVVVIANGTLLPDDVKNDVFLAFASVPRPDDGVRTYTPTGSRRAVCLISFGPAEGASISAVPCTLCHDGENRLDSPIIGSG